MINKRIVNKFKVLVAPISVIAAVVLIFFNFVFPKINQVLKLRKDITAQKEKINALSAKANDLRSLSEAELFSTSGLLLSALPSNKDFYLILSTLQKIFLNEGWTIKSYQFNPGLVASGSAELSTSDDKRESFPVKLFFNGDREKLPSVVAKIEKALPLFSIDYLKIESIGIASAGGSLNIDGSITVNAFYSPLPQKLGKIGSLLPKMTEQKKAFAETLRSYTEYPNETLPVAANVFMGKENPFPY